MKIKLSSKWGFQVEGEKGDLDNLRKKFGEPFSSVNDIFTWSNGDVLVLRSSKWDSVSDDKIYEVAKEELRLISGCLYATDVCEELSVGTIYHFTSKDKFQMSRYKEFTIYVKKPIEEQISANSFKNIIRTCSENESLSTAFILFGQKKSWFNIYMCIEAIYQHYGGESQFHKKMLMSEVKKIKETANSFRHVRKKQNIVVNAVSMDDAYKSLNDLLHIVLRDVGCLLDEKAGA